MNEVEYRRKQIVEQDKLLREYPEKPGIDRDIWNLKFMLTEISPRSRAWRFGYIRSLRRAIKALEKEREVLSGG